MQRQQENTFPPGHQVILPRGSLTCTASPRADLCPVPPARAVPHGQTLPGQGLTLPSVTPCPQLGLSRVQPCLGMTQGLRLGLCCTCRDREEAGQGWGCCQPGAQPGDLLGPGSARLFGAPCSCHQPLLRAQGALEGHVLLMEDVLSPSRAQGTQLVCQAQRKRRQKGTGTIGGVPMASSYLHRAQL